MTEKTVDERAYEIGWRPQAEFKGDPEKWVNAAEFLRRGEEILPLVKAENKRLHDKTDTLAAEISRLTAALGEQRKSMDEMARFNLEQLGEKLAEQKRTLTAQLREARKDEDDDRVAAIEDQLEENADRRKQLKEAPKAAPTPQTPQSVPETPEYKAWTAKNPWFGGASRLDQAKTAAAQQFGIEAARAGKRNQAFFDHVDEAMAEAYPPSQGRGDPTEEGRPSGGGGSNSSSDKGFNGLPAEAKAKAREQSGRFVGANKMFKTEAEWFSYYAKQYNMEAA